MNDQNDDSQSYALMVLAGVVALVIAGVLALAISTTMGRPAGKPAAPAALTASKADAGQADGRIYFDLGSAALPAEAAAELDRVATAARAGTNATVLISGYHDASGDAAQNAELAKQRAQAVRYALEANGVAPDHLVMAKPVVAEGATDPREARRVELRLR
jgi:outer membrane protein OmpA-like peptidoglycan-associated protein